MIVVGVNAPISAGKDTVAKYLCRAQGFTRIAFADPIKDEVLRILSRTLRAYAREYAAGRLDLETDEWDTAEWDAFVEHLVRQVKPPVIGCLLQEWGTELRRAEDKGYWVRQAASRLEDLCRVGVNRVVVSDVRFPDEARWVRQVGGWLVRIGRPDADPSGRDPGHASETSLADWRDWDLTLVNDGTVPALESKVAAWILPILGGLT